MWLAHALSLVRVPLAAGFWLLYDRPALALGVVALAALSDALDGWAARRIRAGGSSIGGWLDPLCDKLFVIGALAAVVAHARPPLALIALIGARELVMPALMLGYLLVARGRPGAPALRAAPLGKVATVAQFAAVLALLAGARMVWLFAAVAAGAGLAACVQYAVRGARN